MNFLIKLYILLIISVISFNNVNAEDKVLSENNEKESIEIVDKVLSDYKECIMKSVFEKPYLNRTISFSVPVPSVRTINSSKKNTCNFSHCLVAKVLSINSHQHFFKIFSENHSLLATDICYVVLRHIII